MNDQHRTWETDMSDAFDRRVRDLHEAPLSFEQVTTRARRIKRRRQAAVAGGVLAVAAIVAPVAVIAADNGPGRSNDVPAATNGPSATETSSPGLPDNGPTIGIGHLEGSTFVRGDGVTFRLSGTDYQRADQLGSEIVAYRVDPDTGIGTIDVFRAPAEGGEAPRVAALEAASGYVTDPEGLVIAYRTPEGELMTRWDGGEVSFGSDYPTAAYPAAITGGPNCNEEVDGCVIYLNDGNFVQAPISVSSHGTVDTAVPDSLKINDVDAAGLVAVQTSYTDTGSCSGLYDSTAGDYLFETCKNTLGAISPSGSAVIAGPEYLDGFGDTFIAILDRQGNEVGRYDVPAGGAITTRAWEDPGHVVFTVYLGGSWSVWRLGTDGDFQQIAEPVKAPDSAPPVVFFQ